MVWRMFLSVSALAVVSHLYLGWRLITPMRFSRRARVALWALLGLIIWAPIAANVCYRLYFDRAGTTVFDASVEFGMVLLGLFGILASYQIIADGIWLIARLAARLTGRTWSARLIRRARRLSAITVVTISLVSLAAGLWEAQQPPMIERVIVKPRHLPAAFDGFTIVQLSDIHLGMGRGAAFLDDVVTRVNALKPDLVVNTGDIADGFPNRLEADLDPLWRLNAPWGVFHVNGNHEYYWDGDLWAATIARRGITVLHNASRVLAKGDDCLILSGVPDPMIVRLDPTRAPSLREALKGTPDCPTKILLAHQPEIIDAARRFQYDLVLSGHIHGGQIFPWSLIPWLVKRNFRGYFELGDTTLYVSRGTGYWGPPVRLLAPPEITLIVLKR